MCIITIDFSSVRDFDESTFVYNDEAAGALSQKKPGGRYTLCDFESGRQLSSAGFSVGNGRGVVRENVAPDLVDSSESDTDIAVSAAVINGYSAGA